MNTPTRNPQTKAFPKRKYTAKEKQQLLENLDIEVEDRIRRFRDNLADTLARFRTHQEALIVRLPKAVRSITMAEFGDLYNGDVQACLRGLQKGKQNIEPESITPAFRKRKWQESQDDSSINETPRSAKTPRAGTPSPMKTAPTGTRRTPGRNLFSSKKSIAHSPRMYKLASLARPPSPLKQSQTAQQSRAPSSALFNPLLPSTPAYPRKPRRHESLMSINGSPLANPLDEELDLLNQHDPSTQHNTLLNARGAEKRVSSILIKRGHAPTVPTKLPKTSAANVQTQGFISVPTKDGHVLEFDPFTTTPKEIDLLGGVSDSAKKIAKEDVMKFISTQMAKWTLS